MRRTFRRSIHKTLAQNIPPVLQEANFTFDKGEYGRAAELYENIARTADARGGQAELGIPSLKRGLELFTKGGQPHRLDQARIRVIDELNARGHKAEAAEMAAWLNELTTSRPDLVPKPAPLKKTDLPTHCSSCDAAVRPDEVKWLDEATAECAYCGSPIQ
jgi:hypothetical protein